MSSSTRAPQDPAINPNLEIVLSARRVDLDDHTGISTSCRVHELTESGLRAVIDAFGPLSDSLDVYVTV